jgi:hypothetical protein
VLSRVGFDPITLDSPTVLEYLREDLDNIVFISGNSVNFSNKEAFRNNYTNQSFVKFGCYQIGSPYHFIPDPTNVDKSVAYFNMRNLGVGSGLVPISQINKMLQTRGIRVLEISGPVSHLPAITSQYMIEDPTPDATGADHCQGGSGVDVHNLLLVQIPSITGGMYKPPKKNKSRKSTQHNNNTSTKRLFPKQLRNQLRNHFRLNYWV